MVIASCCILERNLFHCHFDYLQNINKTELQIFEEVKKVHYNQMIWTLTAYSHLQPVSQRLILEDISFTSELMKSENEYLLEVNCLPHILHNAVEYTTEKFSFGCNGCVTKVSFISSPFTKAFSKLWKLCQFISVEYTEILRLISKMAIIPEIKEYL